MKSIKTEYFFRFETKSKDGGKWIKSLSGDEFETEAEAITDARSSIIDFMKSESQFDMEQTRYRYVIIEVTIEGGEEIDRTIIHSQEFTMERRIVYK